MALYMISGKVTEGCTIKIIQEDEFKVEKIVGPGTYVIYFESDNSSSPITACAENPDGILISFGNIRPVEVLHKD